VAFEETDEKDDELLGEDPAMTPDGADPPELVRAFVPPDITQRYEIYSYRSAAVILAQTFPKEYKEILDALRAFSLTTDIIRTAGGNESDIPKLISSSLRPQGWHETSITGDLLVQVRWREITRYTRAGKPKTEVKMRELKRERYMDGHKIDYVKGRVAFDLEWNSKDQTFDRDLYAFNAFAQSGAIDVAILLTRSKSLNEVFKAIGPALKKDGSVEMKKNGLPRPTMEKFGASTTWMGKLLYRLNAGRNGGCPVLAVGITPACVSDWPPTTS
jgi:hypothetical protein